jgi:hypothetical protein
MDIKYLGGPGLVRAYSLELLAEAARQHRHQPALPRQRRLLPALGRVLRGIGRPLTRLGDRLTDGSPSALRGCG